MGCTLSQETVDKTIEFHGHSCPGLAIGLRASELAMEKIGIHESAAPLAVVETDMCAVDAIQFLTGCTYGKGNLVHRDYGKSAFTFFDRESGRGFRAVFTDLHRREDPDNEAGRLMGKIMDNTATDEEKERAQQLRAESIDRIMTADLAALFSVREIDTPPVRPARILASIQCQSCDEMVMESRIRRFDGKDLCIPCFMALEQKI